MPIYDCKLHPGAVNYVGPEVHRPEFIVVTRDSSGCLRPAACPVKHETRALANKEAVRLAGLTPGMRYDVFESTLHAEAPVPAKPNVKVVSVAEPRIGRDWYGVSPFSIPRWEF